MQELLSQLARIERIPDDIHAIFAMLSYMLAFLFFNLILTFISAHRAAKAKAEIQLLRTFILNWRNSTEQQRSAKAAD